MLQESALKMVYACFQYRIQDKLSLKVSLLNNAVLCYEVSES